MKIPGYGFLLLIVPLMFDACSKDKKPVTPPPVTTSSFGFEGLKVNGVYNGSVYKGINLKPVIRISFTAALNVNSVSNSITFTGKDGSTVNYTPAYDNHDSTIIITPPVLQPLTQYTVSVSTNLKSTSNAGLQSPFSVELTTAIDSTDKFPRISDDALLDLVQRQTFKYFWDFGHPVSGLARERNTSGDVVTMGGSGFGIMAIVAATNRNFITRAQALARMQTIVGFLKNTAQTFHGAYPHWMNGATGVVVPFSTQDDGADIVETAYLMEGLLTARQYFNEASTDETNLRNDINTIWNRVEWDWFRQNGQNTLYWHWSPDYGWSTGVQVNGWDEALITYVMATSSPTHAIPKIVYDNGWALNGQIRNGNTYFGVKLPLGPPEGGPLFFAHYSFLGVNPNGLTDNYAAYDMQNKAHSMINYDYCVTNVKGY
ncbi:MAG: Ig-like domain-containing protein, partial [Bacteroidetes bacterium]|nr:Ig-like domain-containing protein [Bacteroidota bacterium]